MDGRVLTKNAPTDETDKKINKNIRTKHDFR